MLSVPGPEMPSVAELQRRLPEVWRGFREAPEAERTIVVCPSITLDPVEIERLGYANEFEERLLCLLLHLRKPHTHVIFLSSLPVAREAVEHLLDLLPCVGVWDALDRLHLLSVDDASQRPLSEKLLERPDLLQYARRLIRNPRRSVLEIYRTGPADVAVARALGLPMLAPPPEVAGLGTKSGARRLFRSLGVPIPDGVEDLGGEDDLVSAVLELAERPALTHAVVKLNDAFSGRGNGILSLGGLRRKPDRVRDALRTSLKLQDPTRSPEEFLQELGRQGGVLEAMIDGVVASPSVQLFLTPLGEVEILSTHDQLLAGPDGQTYVGCRMPAAYPFRRLLHDAGLAVGMRLAHEGVIGNVAVDFVASLSRGRAELHAIEINLRKGGTTHPLYALRLLTGGRYDSDTGEFRLPDGSTRCYVATDHLPHPRRAPHLAVQSLVRRRLRFDPRQVAGVILHLLSAAPALGFMGATCVEETPAAAAALFSATGAALLEEPSASRLSRSLPALPEIWARRALDLQLIA